MNLGETIYRLRVENNFSQDGLADALGVSRQSVSKWENNMSVPELDKLVKLSELFGVTLDELVRGRVSGEEKKSPDSEGGLPAGGRQRTMPRVLGMVFLGIGIVLATLSLFVGWFGLLLAFPFLLCSAFCLKLKKHIGLCCVWAWYFSVYVYLGFATGITWKIIRLTACFEAQWNYTRLMTGWIEVLAFVALLIFTIRAMCRAGLRFAGRNRFILIGLWTVSVLAPIIESILNRIEISLYQNVKLNSFIYPMRFAAMFFAGLQAVALAGALGMTLAVWKNRRKS